VAAAAAANMSLRYPLPDLILLLLLLLLLAVCSDSCYVCCYAPCVRLNTEAWAQATPRALANGWYAGRQSCSCEQNMYVPPPKKFLV
jgi:hypothetical protein